MAANPERRTRLLDAAILLLGDEGARQLSFRTVDKAAAVPIGTCSNYFASRSELVLAVAERVFERLAPSGDRVDQIRTLPPDRRAEEFVVYIVQRLIGNRVLALALVEIRLMAARDPALADVIAPFLRQALATDQAFHQSEELPDAHRGVELLHYSIDGLVVDYLTVPIAPASDPEETARILTRRLLSGATRAQPSARSVEP